MSEPRDEQNHYYDGQSLVALYDRWRRRSAWAIWLLLAFLIVAVMIGVALQGDSTPLLTPTVTPLG